LTGELGSPRGVQTGTESDLNKINDLKAESVGSQHLSLRQLTFQIEALIVRLLLKWRAMGAGADHLL
jgi:Rod binding domain-containing protein